MKKPKVLLIGPYTAIGGVSMHIKRLAALIQKDFDFDFVDESPECTPGIFHLRSGNLFKYISLLNNAEIVHVHTSIWWIRGFHLFWAKLLGKKIVVSFHALLELQNSPHIEWIKSYAKWANKIIVVNQEMVELLDNPKTQVKEAFLPPDLNSELNLPKELEEVLQQNSDKKIIVSNAFRLDLHNNEDLYGLDLMVDVAARIKSENLPYKIVFVVASKDDKYGFLKINQERIEKENLQEQIEIFNHPISFVKLVDKADLVVRATNTDGDALTIREALYLQRPIIASDAVQRPEGTFTFQNRNSSDLFEKIHQTLQNSTNEKISQIGDSYRDFYLNLYQFD
jgi:glycosyltransferase involved in cell wall biosynthesis